MHDLENACLGSEKGFSCKRYFPWLCQHNKIDGFSPLSKMYSIFLCIPRKYVRLVSFLYYLCEIRSRNLFTGNLNPRLDNCRPIFATWNFPLNGEKKDKILDFSLNSMLIFIRNNSNAFCIPKHFVQNNSNSKVESY